MISVPSEPLPGPGIWDEPYQILVLADVRYFIEACEAFEPRNLCTPEQLGTEEEDLCNTPEDLFLQYPGLNYGSACGWSIEGYDPGTAGRFEIWQERSVFKINEWRQYGRGLSDQIKKVIQDLGDLADETRAKAK